MVVRVQCSKALWRVVTLSIFCHLCYCFISFCITGRTEAGVQAAVSALFLSFGELFMLRAVTVINVTIKLEMEEH